MMPWPSGPTAIFSMYVSGQLKKTPDSATAMIDSAPGPPVAVMLAPSSASSATLTCAPPLPTFSPRYRASVSSCVPSPITTLPLTGIALNTRRMAATAASSAPASSPRPMKRADASAAASVTRAISRARLRSISPLRRNPPRSCEMLRDPDADRFPLHGGHAADAAQRRLHVALMRFVGLDHDRDDCRRAAALLNHGFNTNPMPSEDAS